MKNLMKKTIDLGDGNKVVVVANTATDVKKLKSMKKADLIAMAKRVAPKGFVQQQEAIR